jgi:hypothetical protein
VSLRGLTGTAVISEPVRLEDAVPTTEVTAATGDSPP